MWDWSENKIKLVLIRHGATAANREHRYLGKTDEGLCEDGIGELQKMCESGGYPVVDRLFSSPMKRCLETARILYPDQDAMVISEWEEMDFGVFEGKSYRELQDDVRYRAWVDGGGITPFSEGESREQFIKRCERGFYRMMKLLSESVVQEREGAVTIGMIVHGGTIMSLMSRYGEGGYFDYQVANGQGYICVLKGSKDHPKMVQIEKIGGA